jgi:ABC-type glycerol-3-phosphate transport system substrate-binding protein
VALAACGVSGTSGPAAPGPTVKGKVLVLSYQQTAPLVDRQVAMYADLNKEMQPKGLEVDFVNPAVASNDLLLAKFIAMHVAGTPADLWEWPLLWRQLEGLITDVAPYLKRDKIDEKQWIPESINAMKDGSGHVWGTPVSISTDALAYNLDLLEQAGIKPPPVDPDDRSWTMEAFLDEALKLTKGTQQFGMEGKFTGGVDWVTWPTWFGYGAVDVPNRKVTINAPGYQRGLQFWIDFTNRHHVAPTADELNALRATPGQDSFLTGKVAFKGIFALATRPQFRWGLAAMPYTPNPQQPKNVSGRIDVHALFMDSTSKNKDQAWEVSKYWMRPDTDQRYVLSDGHVVSPILKSGSEVTLQDFKDRMGVDAKAFFLMAQRARLPGWGYYLLKDWGKARTELDPQFAEAKAGRMAVSEFAQKAQETTERVTSF